jgi:arabinose-5-phosphate isomerase
MSTIQAYAVQCFQDEAQALLDLIPLLTDEFDNAVELIAQCKGRVIVTGVGKSGHIGAKIAATLASTGTPSFFLNPVDALHGDLGMITVNDIVLAVSNSGQTDELLQFIPFLLDRKIPLIGMSGNPKSLLAHYAVCHLNISVKKEACPLNLAPTSSTTATLAMGDALACALINIKGFQAKDYARFHPGGSLGKRLLLKVSDVMRTDNLPVAERDETILDVFVKISDGRLGLIVIAENDTVLGIATDGDIRRAAVQEKKHDFFDSTIGTIMNKHPICIHQDIKIIDAEAVFKERKVHSILVLTAQKRLAGILEYRACQI